MQVKCEEHDCGRHGCDQRSSGQDAPRIGVDALQVEQRGGDRNFASVRDTVNVQSRSLNTRRSPWREPGAPADVPAVTRDGSS